MLLYEQACKQVEVLKNTLEDTHRRNGILEEEVNKLRLKEAEYNSNNKENEIDEIYRNQENYMQQEIMKYEQKYLMKEEEWVRLKQILYSKEDIIRKISVAYEQSKADEDTYQDQIEHYKSQINDLEKVSPQKLIEENLSLKEQNKQLIVTLLNHLTRSSSGKKSKRKKARFSGTMVNLHKTRKSQHDNSRHRLSRKKKSSQRKHSSK